MSDLFFNKIAAAALASALVFIGINKLSGAAVNADKPAISEFAYSLAPTQAAAVETVEVPFPSQVWIDGMNATRGAAVFKKCTSCHNAEAGGKNGTGPALWNIVGAPIGGIDGFAYSAAMGGMGGNWSYEDLDAFMKKPKKFVPKTKMAFIGLKKEADRAALIEFLRLRADAPVAPLTAAALIPGAEVEEMVEEVVEEVVELPVEGTPAPETVPEEMPEETPQPDGGH